MAIGKLYQRKIEDFSIDCPILACKWDSSNHQASNQSNPQQLYPVSISALATKISPLLYKGDCAPGRRQREGTPASGTP